MRQARTSGAVLVVLVVLLALGGGGGIAIYASPTCQRFVRTFVTVPVRNRVSKKTAEAWAKWRVGHPNWKPNPAVQRPKYLMTRKEALDKVAFACEAIPGPSALDMQLTPIDLGDLPPFVALTPVAELSPGVLTPPGTAAPPIETSQVAYPGLVPPDTVASPPLEAPGAPGGGGSAPGFIIPPSALPPPYTGGGSTATTGSTPVTPITPVVPPNVSGVPEPPSLWLVALGLMAPCALYVRRFRRSKLRRES